MELQQTSKRTMGTFSLMMTGLGSMIGSGWLFGAWLAAQIAGPAALLSWMGGAVIMLVIALSYTELGAMFPESGGMVRYARYSHGALLGFLAAWASWISLVSVIPIEAEASVQYMSSWPWPWAQALYHDKELTPAGLSIAAGLVLIYFLLNYWSVKLFAKTNNIITLFKLFVPLLTAAAIISARFHGENFTSVNTGGFIPYGWPSILTAIAISGIVFSFNGFYSPINFAGEAKNPGRSIPIAVIGSMLLAMIIYLCLQYAFIGALSVEDLANGWKQLDFGSPFAQLAAALGLNVLMLLLYFDAFISPSGTGATYMATTARMIYAMERNHTMPKAFGRLHPQTGIPRIALIFNLAIAYIFLFYFRGWATLAAVISVACVFSYIIGPTSVMVLRRIAPDIYRPLRVKGLKWIAPLAFVFSSLILYWARWPLTGEIILLMVIALPVYIYYQNRQGWQNFQRELKGAWWMIAYLPAMALMSKCGSVEFGGINIVPFGWDMALVSIVALGFYGWALLSGWYTPYLKEAYQQSQLAYDEKNKSKSYLPQPVIN